MSVSVVDQFETAIRMACLPCQNVPPAQQVPSACTSAITALVVSSSPNCTRPQDVFPMLRQLLAERFSMKAHTESRDQAIYALVIVREGRLGPQLRPSTATCSTDAANPCAMSGSFVGRGGKLKGVGQPLAQLAQHLATGADRMVVDRTGLTGLFDFDVSWTSGGFSA